MFDFSVGGADAVKIEEMEKMLREAQMEKARLIESRVRLLRGIFITCVLDSSVLAPEGET